MKPELYTRIVINQDLPQENLKKGDLAWVIDYMPHPNDGEEGAVLEIFNILGVSIATAVVPVSAIEPLSADLIPSSRSLAQPI